jgi:hypothetical protein
MHVPEENLKKYRELMNVSHRYNRLGNKASNVGRYGQANELWAISRRYRVKAQELRVPGKDEE